MGTFPTWVILVMLAMAATGGALAVRSTGMPEWKNVHAADALAIQSPPETLRGDARHRYNDEWFAKRDALRTNKWVYFDLGMGLLTLGCCVILAAFALQIKNFEDVLRLKTPKWRITVLAIGAIAWTGWLWDMIWVLGRDQERGYYAPWADSIGIGMVGPVIAWLPGLLIGTALAWFVALYGAQLPVNLWCWRRNYWSWFFTACAVIFTSVMLLALWSGIRYGPYGDVPVSLLMIYAILSARAAAVSRLQDREAVIVTQS